MNRVTTVQSRALLIAAALLIELLLQRTYHFSVPLTPRGFIVWDLIHVVIGVIVLPLGLTVLLVHWGLERPVRSWRIVDLVLIGGGIFVLATITSEVGYWVQETLLPLPSPLFRLLLEASALKATPLLLLMVITAAYTFGTWMRRSRRTRS